VSGVYLAAVWWELWPDRRAWEEPGICIWGVSGCCLMWAEQSVTRQMPDNAAWPGKEHAWFQTCVCDTWCVWHVWHVLSQTLQTHVKLLMCHMTKCDKMWQNEEKIIGKWTLASITNWKLSDCLNNQYRDSDCRRMSKLVVMKEEIVLQS